MYTSHIHYFRLEKFIFIRIKKDDDQGKERCHTKPMMSNEVNERIKIYTQHVPLRQNTEVKIQGKERKEVWGDTNE
jgi:hypothetical protein